MKGIDLILQTKNILTAHDEFIKIAVKKDNQPYGDFRLGILPGLAPYLLPLFTQQLSEKYPQLNLKIFQIGTKEMEAYFENERLDGALTNFIIEPCNV